MFFILLVSALIVMITFLLLGASPDRFSLLAQLVKNLPAMQKTRVQSLGWEDPWRGEGLPTPVFWPGGFHGVYSPWGRRVGHD